MTDDGFAWLEQDHRDIEERFQAFLRDNEEPVVRDLCEHLTRHSELEESSVYPALRRFVDGGDDLADRAQQEHAAIATMIAALYDSVPPDRLVDSVTQLQDAVSSHVEFEESEIFPAMKACGVDAAALGADLTGSPNRAG